ncbi:MAG: patatin-like phospholipase family protein [Candidatus Gastranaerophilales bacterium]
MVKDYLNYTCLFGGGAVRGMAYVGAIQALEDIGIMPNTLVGSSVGSIIASFLAIGFNSDEIKDIFLKINYELFKDIQLTIGPKFALSKGEVFLEWLRELIEMKYYGDKYKKGHNKAVTFGDIDKNLIIITTDLSNFSCKEFSKFETPDYEIAKAIRISSSMPGLMKPIEYNNMILVDGDLQKSLPMWKLSPNIMNDNERILEFRLEGLIEHKDMNALDFANAIYSCMTANSTTFITEMYGNCDKFDYVVLNTGDIIIVDFNIAQDKREALIKLGYEQTMDYFKKSLPKKKTSILEKNKMILIYLIEMKNLIKINKIIPAKIKLGELFADIHDYDCTLNKSVYIALKKFKNDFYSNLQNVPLIGPAGIKNDKFVLASLAEIITKIQLDIKEAEAFLKEFSK